MNKFNVFIIGAGNIGAFFDTSGNDKVLTHAHAFAKHTGFNLIGFVDTDIEKAQKAAGLWGGQAFDNIYNVFNYNEIDIACVAVPDDYHYTVLKELAGFPLRVIFAEKPLTKTVEEANEIMQVVKDRNIEVMINYSRRFVPEFEKIKNDIAKGIYGEYLTGMGYYGKGLMHNGSHLVDVIRYLIGEIAAVKPIDSIPDFYADDKSVAAILTLENKKNFIMQYADCRKYTLFEVDMLFEKKRIKLIDSGFKIEEYDVQESPIFKGYKNLTRTNEINTGLPNAMYNAAENIYKHLTGGHILKCSIEDGYKTLQTCIRIRESIN